MVPLILLTWPSLFLVLVHGLHIPLAEQVVLSSPEPARTGILRRFLIDKSLPGEVKGVIEDLMHAGADLWHASKHQVDVYIPPSVADTPFLSHQGDVEYTDSNVSFFPISTPSPSTWNLSSLSNSTFHESYHTLEDIENFTAQLAELHPDLVKLVNIGHSAEGREMVALEIAKSKGQNKKGHGISESEFAAKKHGFVITGAQHSREWIAVSTAMYLAHALVADASEPHSLASLLNHFDFHMVLVPNPDGYKNRQVVGPNEKCIGLDMNRNWGHKWKPTADFPFALDNTKNKKKKGPNVPTDPCSHWYPGHRAFESPEVNNIANYITTLPRLRTFIDLRAYGQMLSAPFSYTCKRDPKDAEDQIEAAMGAARAIKEVHGTVFTTGTLCEMLYRAPGNVVDYMYAKAGIKYSYAAHLRDTGTYGFDLPPHWIRPVGEETVNMIKSLAHFIVDKKSG
ncbi:hypothetical protein NLI96_g4275 [Meripilus lineatus]|uniref:Peptidase M14 domain-containing protein n=1 Tax=Meripilus lineatus TaxID=2056292 RepID=A0AAD5YEY0_9APHY|nr:hypothetical protein NLI96_g4275 [Physisporinus lineatus]